MQPWEATVSTYIQADLEYVMPREKSTKQSEILCNSVCKIKYMPVV